MKFKALVLPVLLASATIAAPAMATGTIILPNDVTVPYAGTGEPQFSTVGAGSVGYWVATDSANGNTYFYTQTGDWVAVLGPTAGTIPNSPAPEYTAVSPRTGQTLPITTTDGFLVSESADGGFQFFDVTTGNVYFYSASDELVGTESAAGSPTLSGSSGFSGPSSSTTSTSTTSGGSSSFGGTSGGTSSGQTSSGASTSGGTTSGGTSSGGSSGGGTDVPAPAMLGLFGMAAAGLALSRRRRLKAG